MNKEEIIKNFNVSSELIKKISETEADNIIEISKSITEAYKRGKKVLVAGNGGSAADAQHISGELVNAFYKDRKALSAIALSTDTSVITAWANDKHYDYIFERQVEAHGNPGDVFIAITTSGNSKNLVHAVKKANDMGLITIGLLGKGGGLVKDLCKYKIVVPHNDTARIQEAHHVIYHTICEMIEREFLGEK